jgi:hypothetical protein
MIVCNRVRESRLPPHHLQTKKPGLERGRAFLLVAVLGTELRTLDRLRRALEMWLARCHGARVAAPASPLTRLRSGHELPEARAARRDVVHLLRAKPGCRATGRRSAPARKDRKFLRDRGAKCARLRRVSGSVSGASPRPSTPTGWRTGRNSSPRRPATAAPPQKMRSATLPLPVLCAEGRAMLRDRVQALRHANIHEPQR